MKSLPRNMTGRLAVFSICGKNRYWLRRNLTGGDRRHVLWIMMNPSRASETVNDATTTMTTNISRRHGYDVHGVVNLSAVIEADSTKLTAMDGAADRLNDQAISRALSWIRRQHGDVVIAWGASRHLKQREAQVLSQLRRQNLLCLGHNRDGSPKFPRGIRRDVELKPFTR
ncbi:MAG: DUF1643 domain-containing protein [Pseudomonadota bacterium]